MKVAIVGSRDFRWEVGSDPQYMGNRYHSGDATDSPDAMSEVIASLSPEDYIVSGGADGADWWAEALAKVWGVGRIVHEPHWEKYGKAAGMIRNKLIVNDADVLFAFYSNPDTSRGTKGSVNLAREKGIPVFEYDDRQDGWPEWVENWKEIVLDFYGATC